MGSVAICPRTRVKHLNLLKSGWVGATFSRVLSEYNRPGGGSGDLAAEHVAALRGLAVAGGGVAAEVGHPRRRVDPPVAVAGRRGCPPSRVAGGLHVDAVVGPWAVDPVAAQPARR